MAVKTNVLYDATTTINLGAEWPLSEKYSFDLSVSLNPWNFSDNQKFKHWAIQPELRYWLCRRWNGSFFGVHALGGQFNVGNISTTVKFLGTDLSPLQVNRYEGWAAGIGVAYGYSWILSRHWNLEGEIGVGYLYAQYSKFLCPTCGRKIENNISHNYFGPTKAAINLVYTF